MHISTSKDVPLGTKQMFLRINLTNSLQNKLRGIKTRHPVHSVADRRLARDYTRVGINVSVL